MRRKAKQRQKAVKAKELEDINVHSEDGSGSDDEDTPRALEDYASETETDVSQSEYDSHDEDSQHEAGYLDDRQDGEDESDDGKSETGSEYTDTASETATETETENDADSPTPRRR